MPKRPTEQAQSEIATVQRMIELYCRATHNEARLCQACAELLQYSRLRIERCPHGGQKPTCRRCSIHCYDTEHRDRIRAVMRYAGPRMLFRHPMMALRHMLR